MLSREYSHADGKHFISLEIYEMDSPAAAFGIYSFNSGQGGEALDVGTEALLQEYYLNVWKGRYLLVLTGADSEETTRAGLLEIGQAAWMSSPALLGISRPTPCSATQTRPITLLTLNPLARLLRPRLAVAWSEHWT